ncbi:hypothetical protein PTSG_06247 [Salpingoeca rosetta]|uniref:Uncharacterized protein n=1 Tax=Salpingoeca rosetta (strain ATCC 50818 / BSB-021) TaxID=946362 RepID=F2UCD0_SALR5|nr:uncharacterized protein PTSG_06247 [Salpingoeca rosetta]EGD74237.1 hypothetical protein PTSG_06247 [Salpingoeca rosetta]|eukprot:XP_004993137.1 hypothetical protein PTSG_06247 [Salpingoeca rosetta]
MAEHNADAALAAVRAVQLREQLRVLGGQRAGRDDLRAFVRRNNLTAKARSASELYDRIIKEIREMERRATWTRKSPSSSVATTNTRTTKPASGLRPTTGTHTPTARPKVPASTPPSLPAASVCEPRSARPHTDTSTTTSTNARHHHHHHQHTTTSTSSSPVTPPTPSQQHLKQVAASLPKPVAASLPTQTATRPQRTIALAELTPSAPLPMLQAYAEQEQLSHMRGIKDARALYRRIRSFHGLPALDDDALSCVARFSAPLSSSSSTWSTSSSSSSSSLSTAAAGMRASPVSPVSPLSPAGVFDMEDVSLREPGVSSKASRVWLHRQNRDAYTGIPRHTYETKGAETQVDHVLEIQLLNHAWEEGVARNPRFPPAYNLRSSKARAVSTHTANDVANLNVTMKEINNKKRGPFTRWLNKYKAAGGEGSTRALPLDELIRASARVDKTPHMQTMIDMGIWDRITRSVVASYDAVADEQQREAVLASVNIRGGHRDAYDAYLDALSAMLTKMDIA